MPLPPTAPSRAPLFLLAAALFVAEVRSQDASSWIGKQVYYREGAVARVEGKDVDAASARVPWPAAVAAEEGEWLRLGRNWVRKTDVRDLDELLEHASDQLRRNPDSANAYRYRAVVWEQKGDLDAAVKDLDRAVVLAPKEVAGYFARGDALHAQGEYEKAFLDFDEAVRLDPQSAAAWTHRGLARKAMGDLDAALKDLQQAVRLAPSSAAARTNLGAALAAKGDYAAAIQDYDAALQLDPRHAKAFDDRGNARLAQGEPAAAMKDYDEAVRLDPHDGAALANRGAALYAKGDAASALRDFDESVHAAPRNPAGWRGRAWLRSTAPDAKFRDGTAALKDAVKACELNRWKDPAALAVLAAAYAESGDFAKAVQHQEKAAALFVHEKDRAAARDRLTLYQAMKPYRVPPPQP